MKNFVTKTKSIVNISILLMLMAPGYLLAANKCPSSISVTTGASGQTVCQNATATDVIATAVVSNGSGSNMTYQWYYNTTNSTTVSGATIAQTSTVTTTSTTTNTLSGANISSTTTGTYYYFCVLTDATCGATVNTGTVKIIVSAGPSDNSGANKTTCSGIGVSIGASSTVGHTYSWSPSINLSSSVSANPTATPIVTTTYSLTETITSTGCAATNSTVVTVNPLPTDNSGANQNACSGASTNIGAASTAGHTYKWSPSTGLSSSTAANPTLANPTITTTYTLTETITSTGCSVANTTVVTVNALPTNKTVSAVATSLCSGLSTNIQVATSTSGVTYQLRNNADNSLIGGAVTGTGSTINLPTGNLSSTTTFNVLATITATGCSLQMTTTPSVTINAVPGDNSGASQSICKGNSVSIGASSTVGHTYKWSPSTALSSSAAANPSANPTITTTYSLTETITATGCSATNTTVVTVNPLPSVSLGASPTTVCSGSSTTLTATNSGGTVSGTISGSNNTIVDGNGTDPQSVSTSISLPSGTLTSLSNITLTIAATHTWAGDLTATLTSPCGTTTIFSRPGGSSNGDNLIAGNYIFTSTSGNTFPGSSGGNVPTGTYNATFSGINLYPTCTSIGGTWTLTITTATGGNNRVIELDSWSISIANANVYTTAFSGGGTIGSVSYSGTNNATSTVSASPTSTPTVYTAVTTDGAGCTASATTTVTLGTAPTALSLTGTASICGGNSANISIAGSQSGVTYQLRNNADNSTVGSAVSGTGGTIVLPTGALSSTTTFNVLATNSVSLCTTQMTGTITITISATPGDNAGSDKSICIGSSIAVGASSTTGHTYKWSPSTGLSSTTASNPTANPTVTTTYTLTETITSTGCSASNPVVVTVNAFPSASISPSYCNGGGNVVLSVPSSGSYVWSNGGTNQSITVDRAGTFAVTVTSAAGCTASSSYTVALELVTNGDFESGNTGFTSTYTYTAATYTGGTTGLINEGLYAVGTNANTYHPNFFGTDHTTGSGKFMIVNGAGTPVIVWQENVTLIPNTNYYFSAYAMSMNGDNPWAQLKFAVNGTQVGTTANLTTGATTTAGPFTWTRFYATWNSGSNTNVVLSIVDLQTAANGNDFGIDDISCSTLSTVPLSATPSTNSPICIGNTLDLNSNILGGMMPMTYNWTGPNSFTSTSINDSILNATTLAAGVYSLTVTDSHGCSVTGSTSSAVINSLPSNNAGSSQASCSGSSVSLGAASTTGHTYSWSPATNLSNSTAANPTATPTLTTTYTLTETISSTGCSASNSAVVTVGSLPTNNAGSAKSICNGGSAVIGATSTAGHTYSWSPATGLSSTTASNPTAAPTITTTYTLTETITATGCSAANSVVVTVNPIPGNNAGSAKSVCTGSGIAIGASSTAGHTYSWSPSTGLNSSIAANPTASPTTTTTYNLTETITATTCAATNSVIVTVNPLPGNNAGTNQSACSGVGASLGATSVAGHTYSWSPSTNLTSSTVANPTATPTVTTTYTLTETITATSCSASNSVVVTPNAAPVSKTPTAASTTICTGSSTNIQIATSQSGVNYQLRNNADNSSVGSAVAGTGATINLATGTLSASSTYNVLATVSATGCTAQMASTVTVTVNQKSADPTSATAGSATICNGSSTTLTLVGGGGGTSETVKWYTASCGGTLAATGNGASVNPTTTTTYYGRYEDAAPCSYNSACATVTVTVNAKSSNPTSATASATSVCPGTSVTLTLNGGGGGTNTVIKWYSGSCGGTLVGTGNGFVVNPMASTTYYGRYEDPSPCSNNTTCASVAITVTAGPSDKTVTLSSSTICSGSSVNIQVASSTLLVTYQLRNNADNSSIGLPGVGLGGTLSLSSGTLSATTTFNVLATSNGCSLQLTNTPTVTVNAAPSISVQPANQSTCAGTGNSVTFSVTASGTPTPTYQWWEKQGSGSFSTIANGTGTNGTTVYSGATTSSLTVANPTSAMNGYTYYCVLTNSCSNVTTNTVSLSIATTGTWVGTTSSDWNTAANWCGIIPTSTTDVTISSSAPNQPVVSNCNAYCHNLTIGSGASLTINTGGNLSLYGSLTVNGTYTHPSGDLTLVGTSAQTIPAISASNVIVNNSHGVTLSGNLTVSGTLTLTNGIVTTGSNELDITNDSTTAITGFSSSSYIIGNLRRNVFGTGVYDYPLGTSSKYEPASINLSGVTGFTNILGKFTNSNPVAGLLNALIGLVVNGSPLSGVLDYGYWTLTPNSTITGGSYSVTLNEQGQSTSAPSAGCYCVIKRHDASSSWASIGTNIASTQSVNNGVVKAVRSGLTSFSDYSIGYSGNVLPIKLISFTAEKCDDGADALLKWSTATEENNDHFELEEASQNDDNSGQLTFHALGEVKGAGTSVVELNYSFIDTEANKSGTRYYRLKQVDFDSTATYSDIVALDFNGAPPIKMSALYPNPVNDMLHFKLTSPDERTITVSVSNLIGQEIFREPMQVNAGENSMNLDVTQLTKGLFFLSLIDGSAKYVPQKFEKF